MMANELGGPLRMAALVAEARRLASTDTLTGLLNRRAFVERIEKARAASDKQLFPISTLLLDVDHFKKVNDTLGHDAGDAVLQGVARVLSASRARATSSRAGVARSSSSRSRPPRRRARASPPSVCVARSPTRATCCPTAPSTARRPRSVSRARRTPSGTSTICSVAPTRRCTPRSIAEGIAWRLHESIACPSLERARRRRALRAPGLASTAHAQAPAPADPREPRLREASPARGRPRPASPAPAPPAAPSTAAAATDVDPRPPPEPAIAPSGRGSSSAPASRSCSPHGRSRCIAVREDDQRTDRRGRSSSRPPTGRSARQRSSDSGRVARQVGEERTHRGRSSSARVGFVAIAGAVVLWFVEGGSSRLRADRPRRPRAGRRRRRKRKPSILPAFAPGYAGASLSASF